jgi:hypothetical protein
MGWDLIYYYLVVFFKSSESILIRADELEQRDTLHGETNYGSVPPSCWSAIGCFVAGDRTIQSNESP